jgi:hypothetical protein
LFEFFARKFCRAEQPDSRRGLCNSNGLGNFPVRDFFHQRKRSHQPQFGTQAVKCRHDLFSGLAPDGWTISRASTGSPGSGISQRLFLKMVERQIRRNPADLGSKTSCRIKSRMRPVHFPERLHRQILGNPAVTHDSHNPAEYLTLKLME